MSNATLAEPRNSKLGPLIHSWSIPADRHTCPGASGLCRARCYAKRGFFRTGGVDRAYTRNYEYSLTDQFVDWMLNELTYRMVNTVRIHVAGDFYSIEYIDKWINIIESAKRCTFFAYTRSWRKDEMLPALIRLSKLPNMELWWSIDRETGPAPTIRGVRRAYMAINDVDASLAPSDCDIVFRDKPTTVMKKANGVQVCPNENCVPVKNKITCSRCGICYGKAIPNWEQQLASRMGDTYELLIPEAENAKLQRRHISKIHGAAEKSYTGK